MVWTVLISLDLEVLAANMNENINAIHISNVNQ